MTVTKTYACKTCDQPGYYEPPTPGDYTARGEFLHHDDPGHAFEVKPQCDKCGSFNYEHYQTNWGHGSRCHDCGYDMYFSLGD